MVQNVSRSTIRGGILSVSVNGGDCRFAVPPNPGTVRIHVRFTDCGESSETTGSATSQPPVLLSSVIIGRPRPELFLPPGPPTDFSGLGVTFTASFARCLLFAQRAHPVPSVGGHSQLHSNRQLRALGDTGVATTAPTFTYTYALFSEKTVWNSHCDGAYPQPQWNCACSAYNSSSQVTSRLRRSVNQYALNSGSATPSEGIQLSPVFG